MAALTLNDLTRDELLCLVRSLNVTLDAQALAQTRVDQAHQAMVAARDAYHAVLKTSIADAKAATTHAERHGFDAAWKARFDQAKHSAVACEKAQRDYRKTQQVHDSADARLRQIKRDAA